MAEQNGLDNPAFEPDTASPIPAKTADAKSAEAGEAEEVSSSEEGERQQWGSGLEFLMSCIAMSVGLGNVWRFPYTAFNNGGGAFLIPYIIVLIVIGRPLYYLEMAVGQFTSYGCVKIWNMVPALKGVGYGQIISTACVLSYYTSLMALTLFYLGSSFAKELPWGVCRDGWEGCVPAKGLDDDDVTTSVNLTSSAEFFFTRYVLNEPDNLEDGIGTPEWRLSLALLGSWLVVLGILVRGVQSSGKAAYFLALFPYVIMITLLIQGATLEGAGKGVEFFFKPQWDKLGEAQVWYAAVTQAFFSLNVGFGSLIVYSSYNNFSHNIYRDAMIVTTLDTFTSLLAGSTIFCILGNLAHELNTEVSEVVKGGTGLAFISYPDAIAKFDAVPQLFAVLFFFMMFVLGVGSAVALLGAVTTIITDAFPKLRQLYVTIGVSISGYLIGLIYVTPGGQWILNFVDYYGVTYPVLALACVETAGIAWIYGVDNICADLEFMLGRRSGGYWRLTWGFITPVFLLVVLIYAAVMDEPLEHENKLYPDHYYPIGWCLMAIVVAMFPLFAVYEIWVRWKDRPFWQAVKDAFSPNDAWGPMNKGRHASYVAEMKERQLWKDDLGNGPVRHVTRTLCGCGPAFSTLTPPEDDKS